MERTLAEGVDGFVTGGAASATLGTGQGYLDQFASVGVEVRSGGR